MEEYITQENGRCIIEIIPQISLFDEGLLIQILSQRPVKTIFFFYMLREFKFLFLHFNF